MIVQFRTSSVIPLEAFSLLGVNVKNSSTAIGRFGTGLKYALAVILRHGGKFRLFVEGVEYEFYLGKLEFRGKRFQQIRMRRRHGTLNKWLSSKALPFTTEFGKDWELWQAYRELESNTRDEGGVTLSWNSDEDYDKSVTTDSGTVIQIECAGFREAMEEAGVFLSPEGSRGKLVFSDGEVDIYDFPSKCLYYQGIRVYDLRYPARFTYDFKPPYVTLTEDRTMGNAFVRILSLSRIIQHDIRDRSILYKMLREAGENSSKYGQPTFETHELNFDHTSMKTSEEFRAVATSLNRLGSSSGGRSISGWYGASRAYQAGGMDKSVTLPRKTWDLILGFYDNCGEGQADDSQANAFSQLKEKVASIW